MTISPGRACIIGTGLIGGSIGLALQNKGWRVCGTDQKKSVEKIALRVGALHAPCVYSDHDVDVTFVATPVGAVVPAAHRVLATTSTPVTDVGSVKAPIVSRLTADPSVPSHRFIGGHPMAGSEQDGIAGARADLFEGAVWVLTPTEHTDDDAFTTVRSVVASLGADVVSLPPDQHDDLVAVVSHVPHLTAASLMTLADERSEDHRAVLRLAAGGFRDMTRVASGHPGIWPDICQQNAAAICDVLDQLIARLTSVRSLVADSDHAGLLSLLEQARAARVNLPTDLDREVPLAEVRIRIFDRPGELARITSLATDLDVNIHDLEIAHSSEGRQGVAILVVTAAVAERLTAALTAQGYQPSVHPLP